MTDTAEVVVCGAGIAGVSAAFHLAVRRGIRDVVLVDPREPLSLTSSKRNDAYREWWPGPDDAMVRLLSRSLDLLEELAHDSGRAFRRWRRGYAYLTADAERAREMLAQAEAVAAMGAGPLRRHPGPLPYLPSPEEGFAGAPVGADWIEDPERIRELFPGVTDGVRALLHVRRAGWLDTEALGHWLLECAEAHGVRLVRDEVTGVGTEGGRVRSVRLSSGRLDTGRLVLAPGPFLGRSARLLGLELPLTNELHARAALTDPDGLVPRDAPLMIWCDPVELPWTEEERQTLSRAAAGDPDAERLLGELPAGVRVRPREEGEDAQLLIAWKWKKMPADALSPPWPPELPRRHGEVLLRGLARMIPALERYFGRGDEATVDGGYDCRTPENRPLVGPLPVEGAYVLGALSSFAVMASQGAAELLSAHVAGTPLPPWAPAFHPGRYDDPGYRDRQKSWVGQPVEL